jgi:superfamily II DNA helicase RecQ
MIHGNEFSVSLLRKYVQCLIYEVNQLLLDKVIYSYDYKWLVQHSNNLVKVHDDIHCTKLGYSFLNDPMNEFASRKKDLYEYILSDHLCRTLFVHSSTNGRHEWNINQLTDWLANVAQLHSFLTILFHITSQCGPARGTEYASFMTKNTETSGRSMFISGEHIVFIQQYFKQSNSSKHVKPVARFIPKQICHFYLLFLCVIRPLEIRFLREIHGDKICREYDYSWMVQNNRPYTATSFSEDLRKTMNRFCGVPIGLRSYRHICSYIATNLKVKDYFDFEDDTSEFHHSSAGHSVERSGTTYGRTFDQMTNMNQHMYDGYYRAAIQWHGFIFNTNEMQTKQSNTTTTAQVSACTNIQSTLPPSNTAPISPPSNTAPISMVSTVKPVHHNTNALHSQPPATYFQKALKGLKQLGFNDFRSAEQALLLAMVLQRKENILAVLPTGHGKSLCYLIPAILYPSKCTIVVVPLQALVTNHISTVKKHSLTCETFQNVNMSSTPNILFASAEHVCTAPFLEFAKRLANNDLLCTIIVDECHLIFSEWRACMHRLIAIRTIPSPVIGLTASLRPVDETQYQMKMGISSMKVIRMSTVRKNLRYVVKLVETETVMMNELIRYVERFLLEYNENRKARLVIYAMTKLEVMKLHQNLTDNYIQACFIHSELDPPTKQQTIEHFENGKPPIIIATTVLGCGYDFPTIRHVCHFGSFHSMEDYHQQSGRASRDGAIGVCIVFTCRSYLQKLDSMQHGEPTVTNYLMNFNACRRDMIHAYVDGSNVPQICSVLRAAQLCDFCEGHECQREDIVENNTMNAMKKPALRAAQALQEQQITTSVIQTFMSEYDKCLVCRIIGRRIVDQHSKCPTLFGKCLRCGDPHPVKSCP